MQFFKIEAEIIDKDDNASEAEMDRNDKKLLQTKLTLFLEKRGKDCLFYICSMHQHELLMLGITTEHDDRSVNCQGESRVEEMLPAFLREAGIDCCNVRVEEITLSGAKALMELGYENDFVGRSRDIFEQINLEPLSSSGYNGSDVKYAEAMISVGLCKDESLKQAEQLLCCGSLVPELERIYHPAKKTAAGHPVHYMIQSDNNEVGDEIVKIILSSLYANKRLQNRRYCTVNLKGNWRWSSCDTDVYEALYKSCDGGALAVSMASDIVGEEDIASSDTIKIEQACRVALKNRNATLTVFRLPRAAERLKAIMREHLDTMTFVEINEDAVSHDVAKVFLRQSARSHKIRVDKALYKSISDPLKTYSISELHLAFRSWYDNQLKTKCYTQYADLETAGRLAGKDSKLKGNAGREFEGMIGLAQAKSVINQAVDYFKAQKLFKDRGITAGRPAMHMVFMGSPGTAKTSAARLFAQIMKDNGLLSIGSLVEVGRADLVGKYVGWTAQIVKSKFAEAKGSVLFIDEAYSLVDDRDGLFGDEAINTIVQEMENRRDDIVVIFAGYTDKMEEFLLKNPGLRSRIAFHVPFADYSTDELLEILELLAKKQSMKLDADVRDKLVPILEAARKKPDFGNGRYMRNLLEGARMKQASRLLAMDIDNVTKDELTTLVADDFEAPPAQRRNTMQIGFCA